MARVVYIHPVMNTTQIEKLESNMKKWSKAQAKNHGTKDQSVVVLPCECSKCRQPRLTEEEAEFVADFEQSVADHAAAWAGRE